MDAVCKVLKDQAVRREYHVCETAPAKDCPGSANVNRKGIDRFAMQIEKTRKVPCLITKRTPPPAETSSRDPGAPSRHRLVRAAKATAATRPPRPVRRRRPAG